MFSNNKPNLYINQINQVQKEIYVLIINQINFDKTKYIGIFTLKIIINLTTHDFGLFKLKSFKN